jgi:hypothetical protein
VAISIYEIFSSLITTPFAMSFTTYIRTAKDIRRCLRKTDPEINVLLDSCKKYWKMMIVDTPVRV